MMSDGVPNSGPISLLSYFFYVFQKSGVNQHSATTRPAVRPVGPIQRGRGRAAESPGGPRGTTGAGRGGCTPSSDLS